MKMSIVIALMLLALVTVGYSQDQGKDESLDAALKEFQQAVEKIPTMPRRTITLGLCIVKKEWQKMLSTHTKNVRNRTQFCKKHITISA